jgi:hypothetical protein
MNRPQLQIIAPGATPEEAAAVVAALEQFIRETAPVQVAPAGPGLGRWHETALQEGVRRAPELTPRWS